MKEFDAVQAIGRIRACNGQLAADLRADSPEHCLVITCQLLETDVPADTAIRAHLYAHIEDTLDLTVEEAVAPLAGLVGPGEALYEGGPVQRTSPVVLAELARPDLADILVFGSVGFLVGDVPPEVQSSVVRARVYAGYSGWGPGQLEGEMEQGAWIVDPAREEDVFTDAPDTLWPRVLQRKGPEYRRLSQMPFDPSMN